MIQLAIILVICAFLLFIIGYILQFLRVRQKKYLLIGPFFALALSAGELWFVLCDTRYIRSAVAIFGLNIFFGFGFIVQEIVLTAMHRTDILGFPKGGINRLRLEGDIRQGAHPMLFAYIFAYIFGIIFAGILAGVGTALAHNYTLVVPAILIGPFLALIGLYGYVEHSPYRETLLEQSRRIQGPNQAPYWLLLGPFGFAQILLLFMFVHFDQLFDYHICACPLDSVQLMGLFNGAMSAVSFAIFEMIVLHGIFILIYGMWHSRATRNPGT